MAAKTFGGQSVFHSESAICANASGWFKRAFGFPVVSAGRMRLDGDMDFETLSRWADEEIKSVVKILPADIQAAAKICSLHFEERPGSGEFDSELEGNELGLFEGATAMDEPDPGAMPSIRIFVTNIWEWTEKDEQDFRDEVGTTFLHELGHYLGWDEDEVADRGLE